jgi:hypothetical protein
MKLGYIICTGFFILAVFIGLLQLWFSLFSIDFLIKVLISIGAIALSILLVTIVVNEYNSDKALKKDDLID